MNIRFADKETFELFVKQSVATFKMERSLDKCIMNLARWQPFDAECVISKDWCDELSFFFQEKMPDGRKGMCGGIIFHGRRDNGGDGSAPTLSVCVSPCDGYAIHT